MFVNKKVLGVAIAGVLFSASAAAAVVPVQLGVDDARVYAAEMKAPVDLSADANDMIAVALGYNFSAGEVRYGRFECTSNMTMDNVTVGEDSIAHDISLGAINGEGTSALFFSITGVNAVPTDAINITVDADNTLEDDGNVSCAFSIYDQPSQAQAGGSTGRIYTTGFKSFITRAASFEFKADPGTITADVEAGTGAYTDFINGNTLGGLTFGLVDLDGNGAVPLNSDGNDITLADIFSADTFVTVDGDLGAATDVNWAGYGVADDQGADSAEFDIGNVGNDGDVTITPDTEGAWLEGDYSATLHVDVNAGFEVADVGPVSLGSVVRNGTQLQAPLVNVPTGWISRLALTNTGNADRAYTISVQTEDGVTIDTANTTGTIKANSTKVIDNLGTVLTKFSTGAKARATLNINVAAPDKQIQGQYQLVSPEGSLSNYILTRPGTN